MKTPPQSPLTSFRYMVICFAVAALIIGVQRLVMGVIS